MPRSNAWLGCNPSRRSNRFLPMLPALTSFPDVIDCTQFREPIQNQGPVGQCTGYGLRGGMSHYIRKHGLSYPVDLSALWAYWWGRVAEGTESYDSGAQIHDVIAAAIDRGVCSEENWPNDPTKVNEAPPDLADDAAQYKILDAQPVQVSADGVKTALLAGDPVIIGVTVFDSFMDDPDIARTGIVKMPRRGEAIRGGHCVKIDAAGLTLKGYLDGPNSWGTNWGRNGFLSFPDEYMQEFGSDFWTIKIVGSDAEKQAGSA